MRRVHMRVVRRYPGSPMSERVRLRVWRRPGLQVLARLPFGRALSVTFIRRHSPSRGRA